MRISDWSSDVCSSDLARDAVAPRRAAVIVDHAGKSQPDLLCDALGGDAVGMNVGDGLAHRLFGEALRQDRSRDPGSVAPAPGGQEYAPRGPEHAPRHSTGAQHPPTQKGRWFRPKSKS